MRTKNPLIRQRFILALFLLAGMFAFGQKLNTRLVYKTVDPRVKSNRPPLLLLLHGYGSDEGDLLSWADQLNPDGQCMVISLRAPNARAAGGNCWYELEFLPNGEFNYDYAQAAKSRDMILQFISEACRAYQLDSNKVCVMGFSQGAIMSYELLLYAPARIKAAIPISGRLLKESREHKASAAQLKKLNVFIGHGVADNVIKVQESEKAEDFLKGKGLTNLVFKKYAHAHNMSDEELTDIRRWLQQVIK